MKKILAAVLFAVLAVPAIASAQSRPSDDCAVQRRHNPKAACQLAIEGDSLTGKVIGPNGDAITVYQQPGIISLIRVRVSFDDMIMRSAEDL